MIKTILSIIIILTLNFPVSILDVKLEKDYNWKSATNKIRKDLALIIDDMQTECIFATEFERFIQNVDKHCDKILSVNSNLDIDLAKHYAFLVEKYSRQFKIDPDLILAIITTESHFVYDRISNMNAVGLMQVRPVIWGGIYNVDKTKLLDPETNIRVGTSILKYYYDMYNQHMGKAITAYCYGHDIGVGNSYVYKVTSQYLDFKLKYPS